MLQPSTDFDVLIVGGGLAGLSSALRLAGTGRRVALIEKKQYPFHKVCGEYVSNETLPFLNSLGVWPQKLGAVSLTRLQVSAPGGRMLAAPLPLGGFGISRYTLDHHLYQLAAARGAHFMLGQRVHEIRFDQDHFIVKLDNDTTLTAALVVGAYGKRETLDKQLNRPFMQARTGFVAVKYHVRTPYADTAFDDVIALHNFKDGYCGISRVEDGTYCLCYLTTRAQLRRYGNIPAMEQAVLRANPHLDAIWQRAQFVFDQPEVINEFSFAPKNSVEQHIWMCGDAAGLITPLCGNGMAMAIHGAKILTDVVLEANAFTSGALPTPQARATLEKTYAARWQRQFATRLWAGRQLQKLFGEPTTTNWVIALLKYTPSLLNKIITATHGKPF